MPNLLLIDDDSDFRTVLKQEFVERGFNVITAADGVRGLQWVLDSPVDLVLLDLKMPHRGGIETLRLIRSVGSRARVILLTAIIDDAAVVEARSLGVSDILFKPVSIKDLAAAVDRALGRTGP